MNFDGSLDKLRQIDWVWFDKFLVYYYSTFTAAAQVSVSKNVIYHQRDAFYSPSHFYHFIFNFYSIDFQICSTMNSCQTLTQVFVTSQVGTLNWYALIFL